jgi:hypothetical protein
VTQTRKIILAVGVLLLPVSSIFVVGAGTAWAKKSAQPGTVTCKDVTGSFKFSPALTVNGGSSETITTKSTLTSCAATGGTTPTKGTTTTVTVDPSNACMAVLEGAGKPETLTTKWSPGTIEPSVVSFPAPTGSVGPPITFSLGGAGTTGTGSYMGTDKGASSKAVVDIEGTEASIEASCESKKGLKDLVINGGTATVG